MTQNHEFSCFIFFVLFTWRLGKFNLDANLGIEENGMSKFVEKVNPVSSEGDKDPRKGLSVKGSDVLGGNISKEQKQTHDACTLRPTHLGR